MEDVRETAAVYAPRKPVPQGKVSFEEFLAWADENTWAEWVDGEVVVLTLAARKHQKITLFFCPQRAPAPVERNLFRRRSGFNY